MPIYEYQCTNCHHVFDLMQKINDPPNKTCPQCSKNTVIRLVSAPGFQLKGTGWYATDFKNKEKPEKKLDSTDAEKKTTEPTPSSEKTTETSPPSTSKVKEIEK